jgi:hypothetical protein
MASALVAFPVPDRTRSFLVHGRHSIFVRAVLPTSCKHHNFTGRWIPPSPFSLLMNTEFIETADYAQARSEKCRYHQ